MNAEYYEEAFHDVCRDQPVLVAEREVNSRHVELIWEDVRYREPRHEGFPVVGGPHDYCERLRGVWGAARAGEIVAVVGEHGSGKSLLLGVLAGHVTACRGDSLTGRVLVNGTRRQPDWRRMCAHVLQTNDELHGLLTVQEQLQFRAEFALPDAWSAGRRKAVVDRVIADMDLERVRFRAVDRVSVCERRRLAIGQVLVGLPRVLLLDEPTEGLDPTTALETMRVLRRLAMERQMTLVVAVKHVRQAILPLFDRILLLAGGGTVFYGPLSETHAYFSTQLHVELPTAHENPLAAMLDAVNCRRCRESPGQLERLHRTWQAHAFDRGLQRAVAETHATAVGAFYWHRGWGREFWEQLVRSWLLLVRNRTYWIGQVVLAMILCLVTAFSAFRLGDEFYDIRARANVLYYTAVFFQFFPFIPFLFFCYRDKRVLARERRDSLCRVSPAYLSIWAVVYGFRFLLVTVYAWVLYFIVGLRLPVSHTLVFWLTLLAEAWVAMGMGFLIVTFIPSLAVAETTASFVLLCCIWFSGDFAFNPACTWILRWIAYLSPIFYSFNALLNNEFDGNTFESASATRAGLERGRTLLENSGYVNFGLWASVGALLGFGALYMALGYPALFYVTRPRFRYL